MLHLLCRPSGRSGYAVPESCGGPTHTRSIRHPLNTPEDGQSLIAATVEAFAHAILALDDSMPNGTYIDMCSKLPVVDPLKIAMPTLVLRGQYDGIASFADLVKFFERLPNPDKQFAVMPGIAHTSTRSKNWALVYHLLDASFSQPAPVYTG